MRWIKTLAAFVAVLLGIVACGGGGSGAGTPVFGGEDPSTMAADLSVVLNKATVQNTGSDVATVTVTALDTNRNVMAGVPITFTVDGDATVQASATETASNGTLTADVNIGANRSNRIITVTARSGEIVRSATITVVGATLRVTGLAPILAPNVEVTATYRLTDQTDNPMAGQTIEISGTHTVSVTGTTDDQGQFQYKFTTPSSPVTDMEITALAAGAPLKSLVQVQTSSVDPVPLNSVLSATASANPSVVAVNTAGSLSNQTVIRALFLGAANARIPNVRVRFDLAGDPNSIGGSLSPANTLIYSDANGYASTSYIPGTTSSPTNGVTVRACWDYNNFQAGTCPHSTTAKLTVVSEALRVTIGTDEIIQLGTGTYIKDYVVLVYDAAGRAKADVEVTPSLDLLAFYKGEYTPIGLSWTQVDETNDGPYTWNGSGWVNHFGETGTKPSCPNEDANRNGVLESGEDLNGNSVLDPAGVTVKVEGSSRTDASGKVIVRMEYPRDRGSWIDFKITATASVAGSEGKADYIGTKYGQGSLPVPAEALNNTQVSPAFVISPYGRSAGCTNTD
jgi:hypothetical protein